MHVCYGSNQGAWWWKLKSSFLGPKKRSDRSGDYDNYYCTAQAPMLHGRRYQHLCILYILCNVKISRRHLSYGTLKYAHVRCSNSRKFQLVTM